MAAAAASSASSHASTAAAASASNAKRRGNDNVSIITQLQDCSMHEGEEQKLQVRISAPLGSRVSWLRDGQRLTEAGGRLQLQQDEFGLCQCCISAACIEDSGLYSVRVLAPNGQCVQSSATVTVIPKGAAAKFKDVLPAHKSVHRGKSLLLRCRCIGQPAPTLRWLRAGRQLPPSGGGSSSSRSSRSSYCTGSGADGEHWLEISAAQLSDSVTFTAIAANQFGDDATHCAVQVVDSPKSSSPPSASPPSASHAYAPHFSHDISEHMHAHVNDKLTMNCKVNGHPAPTVSWLKGTDRIHSNDDFVLSVHNGIQQLTIPHVTFAHAGMYRIVATNSVGVAECRCELRVEEEPEESDFSEDQMDEENASRLSLLSDPVSVFASASSDVAAVVPGDSRPPEFVRIFHDEFYHSGDSVLIICELAPCFPQPLVQWTFNGEPIEDDASCKRRLNQVGRQYQLSIANVNASDAGRYCMMAENVCGSASCAGLIIVQDCGNGAVKLRKVIECSTPSGSSRRSVQVWQSTANSLLLSG